MLIDKQHTVEVHDVITIKLISGEEIIGTLVEQTKDAITLSKPVSLMIGGITKDGKGVGMNYLPVLGSVEPNAPMRIMRTALAMYPMKTGKDFTNQYIEMTSGIIVPKSNGSGILL